MSSLLSDSPLASSMNDLARCWTGWPGRAVGSPWSWQTWIEVDRQKYLPDWGDKSIGIAVFMGRKATRSSSTLGMTCHGGMARKKGDVLRHGELRRIEDWGGEKRSWGTTGSACDYKRVLSCSRGRLGWLTKGPRWIGSLDKPRGSATTCLRRLPCSVMRSWRGCPDWTGVLCDGLKEKFPVLKVIGNLIYNRYINPIIVAQERLEFQVL